MEFNCNLIEHNLTYYKIESISLLQFNSIGLIVQCLVATFGLINNIILFITFYRLNWFRMKQMVLIWNAAVADFVLCFAATATTLDLVIKSLQMTDDIQTQKFCVNKWAVMNCAATTSQTFALMIAVDRLIAKWYPFKWFSFTSTYRWCLVAVTWTWGIFHQSMFSITSTIDNMCLTICVDFVGYPNNWWHSVAGVCDNSIAALVVVIYIIIPIAGILRFRSCAAEAQRTCYIINFNKLLAHQKLFMARLITVSGIIIFCFLCTSITGTIFAYVVVQLYPNSIDIPFISSSVAVVCVVLNSALPLYIWLFDSSFRKYLKESINRIIRWHFKEAEVPSVMQERELFTIKL